MSTARHQLAGAPGTGTTIDNMASRAKNWWKFNAQSAGTVTLNKSFNTSTITDAGVGVNGIAFTSPMTDAQFNLTCAAMQIGVSWGGASHNAAFPTSYQVVSFVAWGSAGADLNNVNGTVMGDLA